MTKKFPAAISVRVNQNVLAQIDALAATANLDRSGYVQMWLGVIARIKREHALSALSSIPSEMLKGFPGRPTDEEAGKVT